MDYVSVVIRRWLHLAHFIEVSLDLFQGAVSWTYFILLWTLSRLLALALYLHTRELDWLTTLVPGLWILFCLFDRIANDLICNQILLFLCLKPFCLRSKVDKVFQLAFTANQFGRWPLIQLVDRLSDGKIRSKLINNMARASKWRVDCSRIGCCVKRCVIHANRNLEWRWW